MRSYHGDLSTVTGSDFVPFNAVDYRVSTSSYTDDTLDGGSSGSAVVPNVPVDGKYRLVLDYRPQRLTLTVTVGGNAASLIEYPLAPVSAGQVSVNYLTGVLEFAAADAGKAVVAQYRDLGTVTDAGTFNAMQKAVSDGTSGPIDPSRLPGPWLQELGEAMGGDFGFPAFDDVGELKGFRLIVGTPNRITVANNDGNAGNPTIDVGPDIARRDVANTFAAAQTMDQGAIIKGLTLPPTQLYANSANVNHNLAAGDVVLSMGNNSASYTINVTMPTAVAGRTFLIINTGPLQNAPVFTATGGALFTWAGGGFVTTYNGPTADHAAYLIYAETTMRWRVFPLT